MERWITTALAVLALACAPSLNTEEDAGTGDASTPRSGGGFPRSSGAFTHEVRGGVITTVADATSESAWQHLDLDSGLSTPEGWDLAFLRFRVRTNGGVSGGGGVLVAALEGRAFDTLARAPEEGWTADVPDGVADDDTEPDNAFNNGTSDWYAYDIASHELAPRDVTYVIASTEGRFFKLRFEAYYDDAGSPAVLRFRWAEIDAPASALPDAGPGPSDGGVPHPDAGEAPLPTGAIAIDASDATSWVYLDLEDGVVTPATPETDLGWDIALRRTEVRTNSGASGAGLGGAREDASGLSFEALTESTTLGFVTDVVAESRPGAPTTSLNDALSGWYDYNPVAHTVVPGDRSYLVRTADGEYAKLRIWRWRDGEYALSFAPVARRVDVVELDVDATASDTWTYVSLRDGAIVTVTDAAADATWDVGFSRTRMRTNGGTSGGGSGAAVETSAASIATLDAAPTDGWLADVMQSDGPPGSPEYSGSPVLASWYAYDPATHGVSPRPVVFGVRTADGHTAALRVLTYSSGALRVELGFAGPGRDDF